MSKYKGLFTFDVDNHRYLPVEQADGIIDCMNYYPELEMPKEPLIKDEKVRGIVRALFDVWGVEDVKIDSNKYFLVTTIEAIGKGLKLELPNININGVFKPTDLCGEEESPEPLEPTFIDLDERIKENEEE